MVKKLLTHKKAFPELDSTFLLRLQQPLPENIVIQQTRSDATYNIWIGGLAELPQLTNASIGYNSFRIYQMVLSAERFGASSKWYYQLPV